jgi:hypothetical protein
MTRIELLEEVAVLKETLRRLTSVTWGRSVDEVLADTMNRVKAERRANAHQEPHS